MDPKAPTFQDAVARLQDYWAACGCVVWQPSNIEVGAGTMNPATFLYVLGPEPWNVAYVEPSVRPDDARYDQARAVYNAMIDRHPALIARCHDVADVISAVQFARDHRLAAAIRGGGHNGRALAPAMTA